MFKTTEKIFAFLACIFFSAALLHSFLPLISSFDAFRWVQIIVVGMGFLLVSSYNPKAFSIFSAAALSLVLLVGELSSSTVFLFYDLGYWASVFFVCLHLSKAGAEFRNLATWVLVAASLGCVLYVPTIIMGLGFWYGQGAGRVTDFLPFGFYGIRPWSHLATWLIPLVIGALSKSSCIPLFKYRYWRILLLISAALWFAVLLGSGARGSLVAQTLSVLLLCIFVGKSFFSFAKLWGLAFIAGAILYLGLMVLVPGILFTSTESYSALRTGTSGRLELWVYAIELSMKNFPFGSGPLSYLSETPITGFATPHSLYFRWAAEYGWLFVIVFGFGGAWLVVSSLRKLRRNPTEVDTTFFLPVFVSVIAAFIHAGVSGVFTSPYSLLVGFPVLVVFLLYSLKDKVNACLLFRKTYIGPIGALLFGCSIAIAPSTYAWFSGAKADQNRYFEVHQRPLTPRFWLHGRYIGEQPGNRE